MYTVTKKTTTVYTVGGHDTLDFDEAVAVRDERGLGRIAADSATVTVYSVGDRETLDHDEALEWADVEAAASARAADLAEAGAAPADLRGLAANRDVAALGADDDATRRRYRVYADALRGEADRLDAIAEADEVDVFERAAADARRTARRDAMPAAEAVRRAPIILDGLGTSPSSRVYALGYASGLLEHAARS